MFFQTLLLSLLLSTFTEEFSIRGAHSVSKNSRNSSKLKAFVRIKLCVYLTS